MRKTVWQLCLAAWFRVRQADKTNMISLDNTQFPYRATPFISGARITRKEVLFISTADFPSRQMLITTLYESASLSMFPFMMQAPTQAGGSSSWLEDLSSAQNRNVAGITALRLNSFIQPRDYQAFFLFFFFLGARILPQLWSDLPFLDGPCCMCTDIEASIQRYIKLLFVCVAFTFIPNFPGSGPFE